MFNIFFIYKDDNRSERSHRPPPETDQYADEEAEDEYSDADDFIVGDDGKPLADKRKKRKVIFNDS